MNKVEEKAAPTDNRAIMAKALLELKRLQARVKQLETTPHFEPVAVVGMACRFPGGVRTPDALWEFLHAGRNAVQEVPAERWDLDQFYDQVPGKPGKMYTRNGYFIDDIASFDREFFNIGPAEAQAMDPQHRLLLETTWEALEYAGFSPLALRGSNTGVFIGAMNSDYSHFSVQQLQEISMYTAITNGNGIGAGRLAHNFGFQGPAMAIDTLCSSSLVSVHLALRSLQHHECDLAMAGGINLLVTPSMFVATCAANMLAADGLCKTYDDAADGYARGEGCGMIVLKRLADAERDNDTILAVLRGSAVNQDGPSSALPVPSGKAQEKVIRSALKDAGIEAGQVAYVETHGTGTALGDPLEIEALNQVYGSGRAQNAPLLLGSIKTNYGHTEGAAGIAGLLKVILALQHGAIPAHLNFRQPSKKIAWNKIPVRVVTEATPWPAGRRIAAVSAFGIGGTNAHMIVEAPTASTATAIPAARQVLTLSAKTGAALGDMVTQYAQRLADPALSLTAACYTSNVSRADLSIRLALVAEDKAALLPQLLAMQQTVREWMPVNPPRLAFLFSGQGSQYHGMGQALYQSQPVFRGMIDRCQQLLQGELDIELQALLWGEHANKLKQTRYTQPALFALEMALAEMWSAWGIKPALVLGHSVGEYACACYAGLFSLEDGIRLIAARGRLMSELCAPGSMAVWFCDSGQVKTLLQELGLEEKLSIAALNAPQNTTVSGDTDAMQQALTVAAQRGLKCRMLEVSHAFHSPMLEPMFDAFRDVAKSVSFKKPRLRIVSNVTGQPAGEELGNAMYWVRHTRSAVKFEAGIRALAANQIGAFLEIGPGSSLISMGQASLSDPALHWMSSIQPGETDHHVAAVAQLWQLGLPLDWRAFHQGVTHARASLPSYPFQRRVYWLDNARLAPATGSGAPATAPGAPEHDMAQTASADNEAAAPKPMASPDALATASEASLPERVLRVIATVGGIPLARIKPEHHFLEDLGYDSMMIMELKSKLEIALESKEKIPVKDIMTVLTVRQLIDFAQLRMA
ncbi:MAG: hypothetical protein RL748_3695 [Pseudomonadota bacterium]|jgi:acyl transferase domain-containing protein